MESEVRSGTGTEIPPEPGAPGPKADERWRRHRPTDQPRHADSLAALGTAGVAQMATTDVGAHRERARSTRLQRLAMVLALIAVALILRDLFDPGASLPTPHFPPSLEPLLPAMALITVLLLVMVVPLLAAGRSPHILYRPDELTMTFDDVRGSEGLVEEVTKTLNLFLAHRTFAEQMGGSPRRGHLVRRAPGHRKDLHGQGHGRRGRRALPVRVLFCLPVDVLRSDQPQDPGVLQSAAPSRPARGRGHRLHRGAGCHRRRPRRRPAAGGGHPRRGQRAADPASVVRTDPVLLAIEGRSRRRRQHLAPGPPPVPQAPVWPRPTSWSSVPPTGPPISIPPCCVRVGSTATSTSAFPVGPAAGTSSTTTWARRPTSPSSTTTAERQTLAA